MKLRPTLIDRFITVGILFSALVAVTGLLAIVARGAIWCWEHLIG
jgi:hypothetical protein